MCQGATYKILEQRIHHDQGPKAQCHTNLGTGCKLQASARRLATTIARYQVQGATMTATVTDGDCAVAMHWDSQHTAMAYPGVVKRCWCSPTTVRPDLLVGTSAVCMIDPKVGAGSCACSEA